MATFWESSWLIHSLPADSDNTRRWCSHCLAKEKPPTALQPVTDYPATGSDRLSCSSQWPTILQQVLAQCGIPSNELTDNLAKAGSNLQQPPEVLTYKEASIFLKHQAKRQLALVAAMGLTIPGLTPCARPQLFTVCALVTAICMPAWDDCILQTQCACTQSDPTPAHILQDCPLFTAQRDQTWLYGLDPSTHPAGLSPLHSQQNPDLARGTRLQHILQDCSLFTAKRDQTLSEGPDPSTHPAGLSPFHSPETRPGQRDLTQAHILQDCSLFTAQRIQTRPEGPDPST